MDRYAVFVDAGYVFAAGGLLVHGTKRRDELHLDFNGFLKALPDRLNPHPDLDHLRTYWYDAATDGIPTPSHQSVARLSGVKLRLGRLTNNQQKGVDSLVVRDLMRLGSEHAIATAYLITGDEDIRQGMIEAQEYGVKVVLVGIEPCETNQSEMLLREADDLIRLEDAFVRQFLTRRETEGVAGPALAVSQSLDDHTDEEAVSGTQIGRQQGLLWKDRAAPEEIAALRGLKRNNAREGVPPEIDREVLAAARLVFGNIVEDSVRKELRQGFWEAVMDGD